MENVLLTAICILLLVLVLLFRKLLIYIKELPAKLIECIESIVMARIDKVEEKMKKITNEIDKLN